MNDYPLGEVMRRAAEISSQGRQDVFQRFTCSGCGRRVSVTEPNRFTSHPACKHCGTTTDVSHSGCNYEVRPCGRSMRVN